MSDNQLPAPYASGENWTLYHGDCLAILPHLGKVDAVVTSPPYAMQRAKQYGGIYPDDYPAWCNEWMLGVSGILDKDGSVFVNIMEHRENGQLSDYVHKTRLFVRQHGWLEVDEIAWVKPNSPPCGSIYLPRRSWERVLWFAKTHKPKFDNKDRSRVGERSNAGSFSTNYSGRGYPSNSTPDHPRIPNVITQSVGGGTGKHPAAFPVGLASWLCSRIDGTILDPFTGSGTTGVACIKTGRKFIGIEIDEKYCEVAAKRLRKAEAEFHIHT